MMRSAIDQKFWHALFIAMVLAIVFTTSSCAGGTDSNSALRANTVVTGSPSAPSAGFTVVLLPDTQCYPSAGAPYAPASCGAPPSGEIGMMRAQMEWIAAQQSTYKIAAVIGLGDIVQSGGNDVEWRAAEEAYQRLEQANIPYVTAIGNHDYDSAGASIGNRSCSKFNQHFGQSRFGSHEWFGQTTYPAGSAENSYITFEVGTGKYLVLSVELFPRTTALQWAAGVVASHPDRQIIVVTHAYLGPDGSRGSSKWNAAPETLGITDGNDGESVWRNLISQHANIIAVVNGHASPINGGAAIAKRVDRGINGNRVAQMLSNYQYFPGGGSGYLRLLNIQPAKSQIVSSTYSPYLDRQLIDAGNSFTIDFGPAE